MHRRFIAFLVSRCLDGTSVVAARREASSPPTPKGVKAKGDWYQIHRHGGLWLRQAFSTTPGKQRRATFRWLPWAALALGVRLFAAEPAKAENYERVGFDRLASFEYTPPDYNPDKPGTPPPKTDQIPAAIKALDQRKVIVTGFMLPVKMEAGLVKEFLLVKDAMMCCYGVVPKTNEWIVVKMVGPGVKPLMDVPISFKGKLRVGEMYENDYLTGLYLLEGERPAEAKE